MVAERSFALKLSNCACDGCMKIINKVLKTDGVHSKNLHEGMVTISGTVEPHALIAAFAKHDKKAELLWEQLNYSKSDDQLQIVAAKPVQGVHDNPPTPPQLQHLSENNQGKANDDDDDDDDVDDDDDGSLAMSTTTDENKIGQSSHKHDLELKNYNKPFICSGCKELGFGPRFKCDYSSCDYELHKECKECCKSKLEISHKFFKGYTFEFFDQLSNIMCDACGKDICGFGYHSKAKGKSLDLHPCCSKLKTKICVDGYDFELHDNVSSKCKWCNKKDVNGSKTGINFFTKKKKTGINLGWSYVSARKRCHFHVYCVTEMVSEAWRQGLIDNIDSSSMALQKMDTQLLPNSKRNDGRGDSDHQFSRYTTKMILKPIVGVLLGDPTMLLASVLVDLFIT